MLDASLLKKSKILIADQSEVQSDHKNLQDWINKEVELNEKQQKLLRTRHFDSEIRQRTDEQKHLPAGSDTPRIIKTGMGAKSPGA